MALFASVSSVAPLLVSVPFLLLRRDGGGGRCRRLESRPLRGSEGAVGRITQLQGGDMRSKLIILSLSAFCLMAGSPVRIGAAAGYDHFIVGNPADVSRT